MSATPPHDPNDQPPHEDGSAVDGSNARQKRRRKVLSCFTCRQRKLKCDREYPSCARCRKAGCANTCAYDVTPGSQAIMDDHPSPLATVVGDHARLAATTTPLRSDSLHSHPQSFIGSTKRKLRLSEQGADPIENRILRLERVAGFSPENLEPLEENQSGLGEAVLFKGRGFKTQFYGATSTLSILNHFPEVRTFMKERVEGSPALLDLHKDFRALIQRAKRARLLQPELAFTKAAMLSMLPPRTIMDALALLYFDNVEIVYCIMHEPSFWRDYDAFWKSPESSEPSFLVILLLVASMGHTISTKEPLRFVGKNASARENAIRLVYVCDAWLQRQTHKHLTLALLQIQCLIVMSKQMNRIKPKRTWIVVGNLVRFGMSAGLHRDASVLDGKVSVPAQEMRKRLWGTIVELELQASFERGMPISSIDISSNCGPPANLSDNTLQGTSHQHPNSREPESWTVTSYLRFSNTSVAFRSFLNNLINESAEAQDYEDVLAYEEKLKGYLHSIPNWQVDDSNMPIKVGRQKQAIVQTILDLQLRQYMIPLHYPFARRSGSNQRFQYSVMVCYEAAHTMLDLHDKLVNSGIHVLNLFRNDILGPALSTCQNIYTSAMLKDSIALENLGRAFLPDIEKAMILLEEKEKRNGSGFQQFWGLAGAIGLVRTKLTGTQDLENGQPTKDAIARVMGICYKVIASQEDPSMAIALHKANDEPPLPTPGQGGITHSAQLDGFEDLSAWAFDDLWNFDLTDFRLD